MRPKSFSGKLPAASEATTNQPISRKSKDKSTVYELTMKVQHREDRSIERP